VTERGCYTRPAVTLQELSERLGCRLEGDGTLDVVRVARIEDAAPGDVTFLANPKYAAFLATTRASAAIVDHSIHEAPCARLRTETPYLAFAEAVAVLMPPKVPAPGISPQAAIDPAAEIGAAVSIGPFAVVGAGARIGAGTILHPHVVIAPGVSIGRKAVLHAHVSVRDGVTVGDRVVLHAGVVIGSDGFGFAQRPDGEHQKIPQVGSVAIEDDVEIGANSTVDRPAVGETRISAGTKIDNLVQVAHGVRIGRRVLLAAQVGIAGSTVLEDDVIMAGQSGATGHVRIGRGARVSAKSAVTKDVEPGRQVAGVPAGDLAEWREAVVLVRRLPELRKAVADLQEAVRRLHEAQGATRRPL